MATAREAGGSLEILEAVERVNERQKAVLARKIAQHFGGRATGRHVAVWGLAFKPGTDDMREAPALTLIEALLAGGATVTCHDPVAMENARRLLPEHAGLRFAPNLYECCSGADALALVTEWHQFRRPNFARIKALLRQLVLFDGRNVWDPQTVRGLGFTYYGIGRP
jgi:UDPglucose 6-dehydrogenase